MRLEKRDASLMPWNHIIIYRMPCTSYVVSLWPQLFYILPYEEAMNPILNKEMSKRIFSECFWTYALTHFPTTVCAFMLCK